MAHDNAASVTGSHIRLTRLTSDGSLAVGPSGSYVTKAFISFSLTPEYEEGDELTQKNASGQTCVAFKAADTLKRVNLSVALCDPDPEFTEMISGGTLLTKDGKSVGWASPKVGEDPTGNGVAIEVWSNAVVAGKFASEGRYYHWIFPYSRMRESGERVIQNDILATEFEGYSVGNDKFGTGPAEPKWGFAAETSSPYSYARTDTAPAATGFQPVVAP